MATARYMHLRVAMVICFNCWLLFATESSATGVGSGGTGYHAQGGGVGVGGTGPASRVLPEPVIGPIAAGISCSKDDPGVKCLINPCQVFTLSSTSVTRQVPLPPPNPCEGQDGYTCYANYCGKATVFRGTPLPASPCSAIYVNTTTGKVVKKCSPSIWPPTCVCPKIKKPVCGRNGKTYGNACLAKCAGVAIKWYDACAVCKKCGKKGPKVCGKNGKTYLNKCWLKCAGVKLAYAGACKPCVKQGGACDLVKPGKKCCPGSICWTGPVAMEGVTKGACYSRKGPLPIG